MAYTGAGIYINNEGPVDVGRIVEIIKTPVGDGCCVLLDHQAGKNQCLQKIREACPEAIIQIRRYVRDWTSETPAVAAARFVTVMEQCRYFTDHGTFANEQDLAAESAGKIGAADGRLMTFEEWRRIADFNLEVILEVRRIAPWIVLHYPGMAYGHGEDWGYDDQHQPMPYFPVDHFGEPIPAYELCRPGIDLVPILNVHPYVQRGAPVLDEWRGVRRIEKTAALFPGKTLFVAETGDFDVFGGHAPDRIVEIAYYLQGRPEVLGYCFFILDSPDPGHRDNNWSNNRAIEAAYQRMTRIPRPRSWPAAQDAPHAPVTPSTPPAPAPTPLPIPTVPTSPGGSTVTDWCPFATRAELPPGLFSDRRDNGSVPAMICDHIADGNGDPGPYWISLLAGPENRRASAHLWVSKTGQLKQYVPFSAQAWSNGPKCQPDLSNPRIAAIVQHGTNPNACTISIEHEGKPGEVMPPAQVAMSQRVHTWISIMFRIPLTSEYVVGHHQFDKCTRANCPGPSFPWTAILTGGTPVADTEKTLEDLVWGLGDQLQKLGPRYATLGDPHRAAYCTTQGEALKEFVNTALKNQK